MTAGLVGGGGSWRMEVVYGGGRSDLWAARWLVWKRNAADGRIWRVTYRRVARRRTKHWSRPDLGKLSSRLAESLRAIRAFSQEQRLDPFTEEFSKALDVLSSGRPAEDLYHDDLAPAGFLSEQARVLLSACQIAWQFGGMGSWNDIFFTGEVGRRYEDVSESLFRSVARGIEGAANSSYASLAMG